MPTINLSCDHFHFLLKNSRLIETSRPKPMRSLLNAQRLLQLYQCHPCLKDLWYLVAATTFSVANHPQEIPKLYHYALLLQSENADKYYMTLAHKTMELLDQEPSKMMNSINEMYKSPTAKHKMVTAKLREALLKSGPLAGLPRAINGLQILKQCAPDTLLPKTTNIDPWEASLQDEIPTPNCIRKPIIDNLDQIEIVHRGLDQWNAIYNKVSTRVVNNLQSSYPDLWYYTLVHCYGPLFSFDKILSVPETSAIVISSLIPQDVNPQLKGHLRGALNVGCSFETVEAVRTLSILVSEWCGITWKNGIVKLKPQKQLTTQRF